MKKHFDFAAVPHDSFLAVRASFEPQILQLLQTQGMPTAAAQAAAIAAMSDTGEKPYAVQNGVAVLPLIGMMSKYSSWWYGGTSVVRLGHMVRLATTDPEVKGILMVVDSPGGFVGGCSDLIADIQEAAAAKPFDVYMQDCGCSAAFFASSPARKIVANPTAVVGSLGVISAIGDYSEALKMAGIRIVRLATGKNKAPGAYGSPVTAEQEAVLQEVIDGLGEFFGASLKAGRKFSDAQLDAVFDGAEYLAPKALQLGLIDSIGTLDTAMANLVARIESGVDGDEGGSEATAVPADRRPRTQPTISANGGGTGPSLGAGTERTRPTPGGAKPPMKNLLVRALTAFKLPQMATAITVATSEEPEALVSVMAAEVDAEVRTRLDNDPLIMACRANSISTASDLQKVLDMRSLGETYLAELRGDAKAEAVRAYGGEVGPRVSAQIDTLPAAAVKTMRDSWRAEADAKFGVGVQGEAPSRQTKPAGLATAADVETPDEPKRAWERLTDAQRAHGLTMGYKTSEKQDAYAAQVLKGAN